MKVSISIHSKIHSFVKAEQSTNDNEEYFCPHCLIKGIRKGSSDMIALSSGSENIIKNCVQVKQPIKMKRTR